MKKFIKRVLLFIAILFLICIIALLLPLAPATAESMLFYSVQKDSMVMHTPTPRVILLGGSSLGMGLNSKIIEDSLSITPINTGISAAIGLQYMVNNLRPHIKESDIIILAPEYNLYTTMEGGPALLTLITDVSFSNCKKIEKNQLPFLLEQLPKNITDKLNIMNYWESSTSLPFFLSKNAFNKYGDDIGHWDAVPTSEVSPYVLLSTPPKQHIIDFIKKFDKEVSNKGATLYLSFPGIQESSYKITNTENVLDKLYDQLLENDFKLLGTPLDFVMSDSLIFDTPYHLLKNGCDLRTNILVSKLKEKLEQQ